MKAKKADGPAVEQHMTLYPEHLQQQHAGQTLATNEALDTVLTESTPNTETHNTQAKGDGQKALDVGTCPQMHICTHGFRQRWMTIFKLNQKHTNKASVF